MVFSELREAAPPCPASSHVATWLLQDHLGAHVTTCEVAPRVPGQPYRQFLAMLVDAPAATGIPWLEGRGARAGPRGHVWMHVEGFHGDSQVVTTMRPADVS